MKKVKFRFLCLAMVVTTVLLSACESNAALRNGEQNLKAVYAPQQEKAQAAPPASDNVCSKSKISWEVIPVVVDSQWQRKFPEIQVMTWESMQGAMENLTELYKSGEYGDEKEIEKLSYTKQDFETKSIIAFYYEEPVSCEFSIKNVQYSNQDLKITVAQQTPPTNGLQVAALTHYCVFVEIGEVIPQSTNVSMETVLIERVCE